jgi:hypothetical protein
MTTKSVSGYGRSKYAGEAFKKTGKPSKGPGHNYIRIMPAMHSLAETGEWAQYFTTHWGYHGNSPSDPTKTVARPFRCIEERDRNKMTIQSCPECDLFNTKEAEAKAYEAKLLEEKRPDGKPKYTEEEIKTAMKSRKDWLQAHGPERKWYINVMYKDGTFGDYKINHRTHKKGIDQKFKDLRANEGIEDVLDISEGVWVDIHRIGDGFSTPDVIELEMETFEVPGPDGKMFKAQRLCRAPLTEEQAERGLKECRDLSTLGGTVLTYQQVLALTKCSGDPDEVDKIFGGRPSQQRQSASPPAPESDPPAAEDDEPVNTPTAATDKPTITPEMKARAERILAERKAKAEAEAAVKAAAEAAAKASAGGKDPNEMDDDEYMKFFAASQASKGQPAA